MTSIPSRTASNSTNQTECETIISSENSEQLILNYCTKQESDALLITHFVTIFKRFIFINAFVEIILLILLIFGAFSSIYHTQYILIIYPINSLSNGYLILIFSGFIGLFTSILIVFTRWKFRIIGI